MAPESARSLLSRRKGFAPEELPGIVGPLAESCKITSVHLFGSRAAGEFTEDSDYDFLIGTEDGFKYMDWYRFVSGLEKALGKPVDVVMLSCLSDDGFSRRAGREAIRVYRCRNSVRYPPPHEELLRAHCLLQT